MLSREATVKQSLTHSQDGAIWAREAAQWLRGHTALIEDSGLVSSIGIKWLTATDNSSSGVLTLLVSKASCSHLHLQYT